LRVIYRPDRGGADSVLREAPLTSQIVCHPTGNSLVTSPKLSASARIVARSHGRPKWAERRDMARFVDGDDFSGARIKLSNSPGVPALPTTGSSPMRRRPPGEACCDEGHGSYISAVELGRLKVGKTPTEGLLLAQFCPQQAAWLEQVVAGYFQYHAMPTNWAALAAFRGGVIERWRRSLSRRSQKGDFNWARMTKLANDWLPKPRILHPWPNQRFAVKHPR